MYPLSGSNELENNLYMNLPNAALMQTMYSTTFGNASFMVMPAQKTQKSHGFPSIPYISLEALLYQGQSSNPQVSPSNIQTGNTTGIQNLQGAQTQQDATGTARSLSGFQETTQLLQG